MRSRLSSCKAVAPLPESLTERLQDIAGNECDQPLYLIAEDGTRCRSVGWRLLRGSVAATLALATLMMLSLALAKEPTIIGDPVRAAREQYSLALTTINVGQGVGAVQWARERGARPGAVAQLSPRPINLGQAVPIDESNAMARLGNNGQSITYSGRQRVWLMDGDGSHRANDVEVDVVAGEGASLTVLDATGERFLSWFVPTMGCCSSLAGTGLQFYTYQSSDDIAGRSASVVEAHGDGYLVARWWLDDETGLPLWVERYNMAGSPTLVFGFVTISIGTAQLATASTQPYPMESVSSASTSGWCVGLPDGVRTLSVSWTPGVLAGGNRVSDDSPGLPQVSVWQVGEGVVSVATNGPRTLMAEACKTLPQMQENKFGFVERMGSGLGRLVGIG